MFSSNTPYMEEVLYYKVHDLDFVPPDMLRDATMLTTLRAVMRDGKIELLEPVTLPDGIQLLVTVLTDEEQSFWQHAGETTLARVWDNPEDDIYAELLAS